MTIKVSMHPEAFYNKLMMTMYRKLDESADVVVDNAKTECPVKTGKLKASIHKWPDLNQEKPRMFIGSELPYSGFVEYGTAKMAARAYLRRGLASAVAVIQNIFKRKESF